MAKRNQPKKQRQPKVPAAAKKTLRLMARGLQPDGTMLIKASEFYDEEDEDTQPVRKVLSWGGSYGWAGRHPADLAILLKDAVTAFGEVREKIKIDAIAFTGSSGAAIAYPLAVAYNIPLIYVRKKNERSHGAPVECNYTDEIETYMIVDDFVSSGKTVRNVMEGVAKAARDHDWEGPKCVGVFEFDPVSEIRRKFELSDDDYKPIGVTVDLYSVHSVKQDERDAEYRAACAEAGIEVYEFKVE